MSFKEIIEIEKKVMSIESCSMSVVQSQMLLEFIEKESHKQYAKKNHSSFFMKM